MDEKTKRLPWKIRREQCAMQTVPKIRRLLDLCHDLKIPVVYTKTVLKDGFHLSPLEASYQPILFEKGMREGTWGVQIIDELAPEPDDEIVIKHRYDAFYNTNLELLLGNIRGMGTVDTLIITGTVTNVCCESTARGAFMRDYKVVFVSDANGSGDQAAHEATLQNISRFFGRVVDTRTLLAALTEGEEGTAYLD
jgi:ureidoacrylate peracid hydrolase